MRYVAAAAVLALLPGLLPELNAQQALNAQKAGAPNRALLDTYCVTCHNQRAKTAGLTFDTMDLAHPDKDIAVWEKAVRKLQGGMMPPPGSKRPDQSSVDSFVKYLETSLDQAAAANPNPGSVTLHRLNRAEYANAIRDLFAIDVDPAALLPTDDISNGFDNIASVLKVSPSFLDQYITAARFVSQKAIGDPPPSEPVKVTLTAAPGADTGEMVLGARAGTVVEHLFPFDGEYQFSTPAGGGTLTLDGAKIATTGRVPVKAGMHRVALLTPARGFVESGRFARIVHPLAQAGPSYGGGERPVDLAGEEAAGAADEAVEAACKSPAPTIPSARHSNRPTVSGFSFVSRPVPTKPPAPPRFSPTLSAGLSGVRLPIKISPRPSPSLRRAAPSAVSTPVFKPA